MNIKPLVTTLDGVLIPQRFVRHAYTWNRRIGSYVDVIDFQQNKAKDAVTINCGVLNVEVHHICWGKDAEEFIEEPACTIRARIGDLIGGHDLWWQCIESISTNIIATQIRSAVLPFLEKMHSETEMENILLELQVEKKKYPPPILFLAALKFRRGDRRSAVAILSVLYKKTTSAWKTKIVEVAGRLGILGELR